MPDALGNQTVAEAVQALNALGETDVRYRLALGTLDVDPTIAREWLRQREASRLEELSSRRDAREEAMRIIASEANERARHANIIAIAASIIAALAMIIAAILSR